MKWLFLSALFVGAVGISSAVVAQDVASLPSVQTNQLVFLEKDGLSPTAKNMLRTIAGVAAPARSVELRGAPLYVDAVRKQLIEDGVASNAIVVGNGAPRMIPTSAALPNLEERSVEIRISM